jgi:hypothetical protein
MIYEDIFTLRTGIVRFIFKESTVISQTEREITRFNYIFFWKDVILVKYIMVNQFNYKPKKNTMIIEFVRRAGLRIIRRGRNKTCFLFEVKFKMFSR